MRYCAQLLITAISALLLGCGPSGASHAKIETAYEREFGLIRGTLARYDPGSIGKAELEAYSRLDESLSAESSILRVGVRTGNSTFVVLSRVEWDAYSKTSFGRRSWGWIETKFGRRDVFYYEEPSPSNRGLERTLEIVIDAAKSKTAEPGATDNPDYAQRFREDH